MSFKFDPAEQRLTPILRCHRRLTKQLPRRGDDFSDSFYSNLKTKNIVLYDITLLHCMIFDQCRRQLDTVCKAQVRSMPSNVHYLIDSIT